MRMKKYFVPAYIEELETPEGLHIYNNYNGAEILLEKEEIEEYWEIKKHGIEKIKAGLCECLFEEEILVTARMQMKFADELKNMLDNTLCITLMPTESCNFKCIYCYETHEIVKMSVETVNAIKSYVTELCEEHQFARIAVLWFGGEPTLCPEIIEDVGGHIKAIADKKKIEFESSMTTNAYLLTKERFERFLVLGITSYQITIDGFEHDSRRMLCDGGSTLKQILDNLREIKSVGPEKNFNIMIRRNLLACDRTCEWYDYLSKEFGDDKRFTYSVVQVERNGSSKDAELEIIEQDNDLVQRHLKYLVEKNMGVTLQLEPEIFGGVCFAAYRYGYLFRANGDVGKCTIELYNPLNYVGRVENGTVIIDEEKLKCWTMDYFDKKCSSCKNALLCMNRSCPMKHLQGQKHICI